MHRLIDRDFAARRPNALVESSRSIGGYVCVEEAFSVEGESWLYTELGHLERNAPDRDASTFLAEVVGFTISGQLQQLRRSC